MTEGKMDNFEGHTPGPWRVIHESDGAWGDNWAIVRADNALEDVAETVVSAENARLIAAAPDLLAERDRLRAEVERLRAELSSGSFYKESDIDAMQGRAESAEKEVERLREALKAPLTDADREWIDENAALALRAWSRGIRGQIVRPEDGLDYHVATMTWERIKARAALAQDPTP